MTAAALAAGIGQCVLMYYGFDVQAGGAPPAANALSVGIILLAWGLVGLAWAALPPDGGLRARVLRIAAIVLAMGTFLLVPSDQFPRTKTALGWLGLVLFVSSAAVAFRPRQRARMQVSRTHWAAVILALVVLVICVPLSANRLSAMNLGFGETIAGVICGAAFVLGVLLLQGFARFPAQAKWRLIGAGTAMISIGGAGLLSILGSNALWIVPLILPAIVLTWPMLRGTRDSA